MTSAVRPASDTDTTSAGFGWVGAAIATLLLLAVTWWAAGSGQDEAVEPSDTSPAAVHHIAHTDFSWVTLTPNAARRIGLEVTELTRGSGPVTVPYAALVHDADGTMWVYAAKDRDTLRFRRFEVDVQAITGDRATLSEPTPPLPFVAGHGSALLWGSEFEVGH